MPAQKRINYTSDPSTFDYGANWASGQPARDAQMREKFGDAAVSRGYNTATEYGDWRQRDMRADMWKNIARAGAIIGGPIAASYAIPALAGSGAVGGGGAAAGAGSVNGLAITPYAAAVPSVSAGSSVAASAPSMFAAGGRSLPWMKFGEMTASTLGNIYASHKQSSANRDALAAQERSDMRAQQIEADNRAEQKRQFDLQQAQLKAQWDAQQKFEADRFAASEEERLHTRQLSDEREARRAPYRAASAAALERLPGLINSGSRSPGLATLGSYRRG